MERTPRRARPSIPGGYLAPKLLAWPWAEARLVRARNYWVSTVSPRGAPHARPVWGVWLEGAFHFSSGSRIRSHLERHPAVSVNLESGDECVILEGDAAPLLDEALTRRVAEAYNEKYQWNLEPRPGEFFAVRPRVVFGWLCDGSGLDGGALFSQSATRWTFE
jgi:hypothetical protein